MSAHLAAYPSYWNVNGKRPTRSGLRAASAERVICDICGRTYARQGMAKHRPVCKGPILGKVPADHSRCGVDGCGRIKPKNARSCWKHEQKDDVFASLDLAMSKDKQQDLSVKRFEVRSTEVGYEGLVTEGEA